MNTTLIIKNTIIVLVAGTFGHSTFAGDQLSSLVDDGSYTPAQRAEMIFGTGNMQIPDVSKSVSDSAITSDISSNDVESNDSGLAIGIIGSGTVGEVSASGKGSISIGTAHAFESTDYDAKADDTTEKSQFKKVTATNRGVSIGIVKGKVTQKS